MDAVSGSAYWLITAALIIFGFVTGFSIGGPFLLLGVTMVVAFPARQRPRIFWPLLSIVPAFTVGYVLVAPLTCTAIGAPGQPGEVTCTSILGGPYVGTGLYNPPLEPALLTGLAAGAIAAVAVYVAVRVRTSVLPRDG
jgi:hypothetical protein